MQPPEAAWLADDFPRRGARFAAADAQRGDTALGAAMPQGMNERRQDARTGCPDRMTECARAAVDVLPCMINVDVVHGCFGDHRAVLVDLVQGCIVRFRAKLRYPDLDGSAGAGREPPVLLRVIAISQHP